MPAISVIMPCHNRGFELTRILSAYERQELSAPFEIIAIDNGSTDNTFEILSSFRSRRFLLRIAQLPTNQGPAAARNTGIK
ncbi:MAG: glycosyltransferase family A protein, partial [Candidatus Methanomethyliaceae archaeon]